MSCNYGCWFGRRCLGDAREDVIEFLTKERPETDWSKRTDQELDLAIVDLVDLDYKGPDHVRRTA